MQRTSLLHRLIPAILLCFSMLFLLAPVRKKPAAGKGDPEDAKLDALSPVDLSLRIEALQSLYDFKFSAEQLATLGKAADTTASKRARQPGKVSPKVHKVMKDLHNALAEADDDEKISHLQDQLDDLEEAEKVDLDDDVEISDTAHRRAGELFKMLSATQIASYVAANEEDIKDPRDLLIEVMRQSRGMKQEEWETLREQTASEFGWLCAPDNAEKEKQAAAKARGFLNDAHALGDAAFKSKQSELERQAWQLGGDVDSMRVLRSWTERGLAQLLSNPQLLPALAARGN